MTNLVTAKLINRLSDQQLFDTATAMQPDDVFISPMFFFTY